jgi:hypothetical protein
MRARNSIIGELEDAIKSGSRDKRVETLRGQKRGLLTMTRAYNQANWR